MQTVHGVPQTHCGQNTTHVGLALPRRSHRQVIERRCRFVDFLSCDVSGESTLGWVRNQRTVVAATSSSYMPTVAAVAASFGSLGCDWGDVQPGMDLACFPFFFGPSYESEEPRNALPDNGGVIVPPRAAALQRCLAATCFLQAAVSGFELILQDAISGIVGCSIATLGLQAATPQGYGLLPTYIVMGFCNGTMQMLLGAEIAMGVRTAKKLSAISTKLKLVTAVGIASPLTMFAGVCMAWRLHLALSSMTNQPAVGGRLPDSLIPVQTPVGATDPLMLDTPSTQPLPAPASPHPSFSFRAFAGQGQRLPK